MEYQETICTNEIYKHLRTYIQLLLNAIEMVQSFASLASIGISVKEAKKIAEI